MANRVSVIITVFNESATIESLVSSFRHQSLLPQEVVVVDGGSKDDTFSKLLNLSKAWKTLKVYQQPGNRSAGRNFAVSRSTGTILAFTDAGCIPEKFWLEELVRPFASSQVQVVSGFYRGKSENVFQACLVPYVLVMPDRAGKSEFFPSTRSMGLRRSTWNKTSGFNEKLEFSEDLAFAHGLKKLGFSFVFAPKAVVVWLPRKTLLQAAWMFINFSIGDIRAGIFRPKVKLLAFRYLAFMFLFFLSWQLSWLAFPLIFVAVAYLIWAVSKNYRYVKDLRAIFWLPVLQVTADVSILFGTLVGYLSLVLL